MNSNSKKEFKTALMTDPAEYQIHLRLSQLEEYYGKAKIQERINCFFQFKSFKYNELYPPTGGQYEINTIALHLENIWLTYGTSELVGALRILKYSMPPLTKTKTSA